MDTKQQGIEHASQISPENTAKASNHAQPVSRNQFDYAAAVLEGAAKEAERPLDRNDLLAVANLLRKCAREMGS